MSKEKDQKQLTAAQRLIGLEQALMSVDQVLYNQAQRMSIAQTAIKALNEKIDAVIEALSRSLPLTDESLDKIVAEKRVASMDKMIDDRLKEGVIVESSTGEVTQHSLVVGREIKVDSGEVTNPRLQFVPSDAIKGESLEKIVGKKVGDLIVFVENAEVGLEIERVYESAMPLENETAQEESAQG